MASDSGPSPGMTPSVVPFAVLAPEQPASITPEPPPQTRIASERAIWRPVSKASFASLSVHESPPTRPSVKRRCLAMRVLS